MQYHHLLAAAVIALPAMAGAADSPAGKDIETDIRVECIVDFVASELDEDRHDAYIDECVKKHMTELKGTDN